MKTEYIVVFDNAPLFLGFTGRRVAEYPDAQLFSTRSKAEKAAKGFSEAFQVMTDEEYKQS